MYVVLCKTFSLNICTVTVRLIHIIFNSLDLIITNNNHTTNVLWHAMFLTSHDHLRNTFIYYLCTYTIFCPTWIEAAE